MTVSTIDSVAEFDTNGITTNYPFYFKFLANEDLVVTYVNPAGVSSTLTLGTHYIVNGAGNEQGGSIVTTSALAGPGQLIVSREMDPFQQTSLRNQGKFLAETHEDVFDRLTMLIQQGFAIFKRALTRPFGRDYFFAENRRITAVKDPVENQDAATKAWSQRYVGEVIGGVQGPINNAANILYLYPNGIPNTVQSLSNKTDPAQGIAGIGWTGGSIPDVLNSVGRPIAPGNGFTDDMPKVVSALALSNKIVFPESANGYDFKSKVSVTLTKDTVIDFNGQLSRWTNGQLILKSPTIATGLTLTANVARAATVLPLSSAAGIQRGDLVYITTTIKPSSDWNDTKKDCVLVTSVSGNSVTLADPLNFHYTTADAGLSIRVYRPVRLELRGLNSLLIAADSDPTPYVQIQAEGIHGLTISNPEIRGQIPFNRDLNPYRVGIQTIVCRDVNIVDPTYEAMSYQVGIYGGSRYITETNAKSYYCHHGHADVGDWSSDYKVKGVIGVDNYQTMSTHPVFRAYAEDVEVHNDYGLQNWRCFGGGVRNGTIRSSADDTLELPQYQNSAMNPGYEYLYDDADFYCDNFDFRFPNRITKAVFGVRFGRTVTISNTKVNDIITSFGGRDNVKQLIVGTGNRIGVRSLSTPGTALTLCPARIDFDVPLDARLLSGVYHVDPRLQMVPHSAGRLACRGSVFTGRAAASPLATNLRLHVNAFSTQSQVNILTGKLKLFSTVTHNSSGDFSTQEKHFNFYFAVRDVSALNFPTNAVFTSDLSGQAGEGVVLTIGTPTFAGVSQIGFGDNYIEVPVVLTASGTSPKFSLSYAVEFNVVD